MLKEAPVLKRITLFEGHYGSGKTNIAVNYAEYLRQTAERVLIVDLDIVNPYFRTSDSREELRARGISVVASAFAGSNVDLPSVSDAAYAITDRRDCMAVVDVGGDDRGAYALGRYAPAILQENDFDNLLVINMYRPLTRRVDDMLHIVREIEQASGLPFTGIVNNSNLGQETTARTVLDSLGYAREISDMTGLDIRFTSAADFVYGQLEGKIERLFKMKLQKKIT